MRKPLLVIMASLCTAALATAACSDSSSGGGGADCSKAADFTSCQAASGDGGGGGAGVCLGKICHALNSCPASGCAAGHEPRFRLADTNLRKCFGRSPQKGQDGTITCPGSAGEKGCASTAHCGQDAQYGWDVTHDSSARFTTSTKTPAEPVVTDTITGLVWQACAAGQSGKECGGTATLMDWFKGDAYCKQATWGGHSDWELPDSHALHSITDFSVTSPALDRSVFPNAPSKFKAEYEQWWKECYWSGTSYAADSKVAWVAMVNSGDISQGSGTPYHLNDKEAKNWDGCYARCVRKIPAAQYSRFIKLEPTPGQAVIADTVTHLYWQACSAGQSGKECSGTAALKDWKSSLAHCEELNWGGKDDWRLPSVKELRSLVDTNRRSPAIDKDYFPNTPYYGPGRTDQNSGQFWSSTARNYNDFALYVDFRSGFSHFYKQPEGRHVRCVRDSKSS